MPNWEQFLNQHVLSPSENPDYNLWNRKKWNNWLQTRLGGKYGSKALNSVVIAAPDEILETFRKPTVGYQSRENFYWTEDRFFIYVLKLNESKRSTYDVRRLPAMYFLALIHPDPNRPVHFHGQAIDRICSGQLPNSWNQYDLID